MAERYWIAFKDCTSTNGTDKGLWVRGLVEDERDLFVPFSQIDQENESGCSDITDENQGGTLVVTDWWVDQQTDDLAHGDEVAERSWQH